MKIKILLLKVSITYNNLPFPLSFKLMHWLFKFFKISKFYTKFVGYINILYFEKR